MGFTLRERQILGIHGLIPPAFRTQEEQSHNVLLNFNRWSNDLDKYIYLMGLQDRNEKLFYRVVTDNVEKMMPIIYTPTVGQACLKYGLIFRKPRQLNVYINAFHAVLVLIAGYVSINEGMRHCVNLIQLINTAVLWRFVSVLFFLSLVCLFFSLSKECIFWSANKCRLISSDSSLNLFDKGMSPC